MLRTTIRNLCSYDTVKEFNQYHFDRINEVIQKLGLTDEDLNKPASMHMCVLLSHEFGLPPGSIHALDKVLDQKDPAPPPRRHEYAVNLIFNENLTHVLLCRKQNRLNSPNGLLSENEYVDRGALRILTEQTGIKPAEIERYTSLAELGMSFDPIEQADHNCTLYYFTGIVKYDVATPPPGTNCILEWHNVDFIRNTSMKASGAAFHGSGDLQFFVHTALEHHHREDMRCPTPTLKDQEA